MKKEGNVVVCNNLLDWVAPGAVTDAGREGEEKWVLARGVYGSSGGILLSARGDRKLPELSFDPGLRGWHNVFVRVHQYNKEKCAIHAGTNKDRALRRLRPELMYEHFEDLLLGPREMTGARLRIDGSFNFCALDSVRFVPCAPPKPLPAADKELCGILDFPCVVDDYRPMEECAAECVRVHAEAGFTTLFWRAFGVCCEYPSRIGQVRTAELDENARMCIGRLIEKYNILTAAADEARRCDVKLLGWMRINNEFSRTTGHFGAVTPFHKAHPEMRKRDKKGNNLSNGRLSFAFPEVRKYLVSLGREILDFGTDGLMIDVMRHPPMVTYDKPIVDAFVAKTGRDPMTMEGDGDEEWLRFRADTFTQLLRDFRRMMDGSPHKKKPIYVRAMGPLWRQLRDGCDLDVWFREGLVDTFVCEDHYNSAKFNLAPVINLINGRARLIAEVACVTDFDTALALARQAFNQGADGTAVYESDVVVTWPTYRDRLRFLRSSALAGAPAPCE